MSELTRAQAAFSQALGVLLTAVPLLYGGRYRARLDWGYRDSEANERVGGHPRSLHMERLAQDVTVYVVDAGGEVRLATSGESSQLYDRMHDVWDLLGGSARVVGDANHFSWPYGTVR